MRKEWGNMQAKGQHMGGKEEQLSGGASNPSLAGNSLSTQGTLDEQYRRELMRQTKISAKIALQSQLAAEAQFPELLGPRMAQDGHVQPEALPPASAWTSDAAKEVPRFANHSIGVAEPAKPQQRLEHVGNQTGQEAAQPHRRPPLPVIDIASGEDTDDSVGSDQEAHDELNEILGTKHTGQKEFPDRPSDFDSVLLSACAIAPETETVAAPRYTDGDHGNLHVHAA